MTTAVIVPWRPDGAERDRAWAHIKPLWPWPVYEGTCTSAGWSKAEAVQDAIDQLPAHVDVLVIADADVIADPEPISDGCFWLGGGRGRGWIIPHGQVRRLSAEGTAQLLAGQVELHLAHTEERHRGMAGGGLMVIRRDDYANVPLDPRFIGWGGEDEAHGIALRAMFGRETRWTQPLFHLWHQPQERRTRALGSRENAELLQRYRRARTSRTRMAALLDEFRHAPI